MEGNSIYNTSPRTNVCADCVLYKGTYNEWRLSEDLAEAFSTDACVARRMHSAGRRENRHRNSAERVCYKVVISGTVFNQPTNQSINQPSNQAINGGVHCRCSLQRALLKAFVPGDNSHRAGIGVGKPSLRSCFIGHVDKQSARFN